MKSFIKLPLLAILLLSLYGCAGNTNTADPAASYDSGTRFVSASYNAVNRLIALQDPTISPLLIPQSNVSVLVATVVDVNNLDTSSAFGRMLAEQLVSGFSQNRINVSEVKLRGKLYVDKQGELLLSRELKDISSKQNADFVVVGTYAVGGDNVYVTLKLVRAIDSRVASAYTFSIPKTHDMNQLVFCNNQCSK